MPLPNHQRLRATRFVDLDLQLRQHSGKLAGRLHGTGATWHPFLSNGHPLDAKIIFIGYNPSGAAIDFFKFWDPKIGFRLDKYQDYRAQQCAKWNSTRPGGTRPKRSVSNTRKRILEFSKQVRPAVFLSTNIYWVSSLRAKGLPKKHRIKAPLKWLLRAIGREVVVVVHGIPARRLYRSIVGVPFAINCSHLGWIKNAELENLKTQIRVAISMLRIRRDSDRC